jgi:hypothetical protein
LAPSTADDAPGWAPSPLEALLSLFPVVRTCAFAGSETECRSHGAEFPDWRKRV